MKSLSINKHDRGRMFYLQSLLAPQREEKETKVQGWVGGGVRNKKKRLPIEDSTHGERVNNAALHTAWRLCGAIAMATPFPSHIFNEKVMRET